MESRESHDEGAPAGGVLRNQVALVTGGGRGFGRVTAEALATAGAAVAISGRSTDALADTVAGIHRAGGRALACASDVTDRAAVEGAVRLTERELGPVDLLVNNAALFTPVGPPWEVDPDAWWRCVEVNLRGPFLCARTVLPGMVARRRGRIVNLASVAAVRPVPDGTAYASSKAALVRFTDSLAAEAREFGIAVFAVDPGSVATGMHVYLGQSAAWLWRRGRHAPKYTPAEDAAALVLGLASGRADALTGRFLHVHDDFPALAQEAEAIQRDDRYVLRLRR